MRILFQPASYVDQIIDGHEMTKQPYPLVADEKGLIENQELWQGDPFRVVGFQNDLAVQRIDLRWADVVEDPSQAVGKYLVTSSCTGDYGSHQTAIAAVRVLD